MLDRDRHQSDLFVSDGLLHLSDIRVHWFTTVDEEEPVVWTRHPDMGRVCCCALGHTPGSIRHPQEQLTLQRALSWVFGSREVE